jgi:uncharacterized protein (DUF58 family)
MLERFTLLAVAAILLLGALTTGAEHLFFLLYLGIAVVALAYFGARRGLSGLEAGSWLDRHQGSVGDTLTITYTLRSLGRVPKPWLEVHSPTTLPLAVPGRVVALGPKAVRTWAVRVPLVRRGQFRVDPMVVRTGDPFGLFESVASVGAGAGVVVFPRVELLTGWKLPAAPVEGSASRPERTTQSTPLVSSVRPYAPGDSFSRIHWRSSARHQELQVKEFDIEQTADVWCFLDLDRGAHAGEGDHASVETAVTACASLASHALSAHRAVGFEAIGQRRIMVPLDRGRRQRQKLLGVLAVVAAEGATPLHELLIEGLPRVRRGSIAMVVTPSLDRSWARGLAGLRARGVTPFALVLDPLAHVDATRARMGWQPLEAAERDAAQRDLRSLRYALAEHEVEHRVLVPRQPLLTQLTADTSARESAAVA